MQITAAVVQAMIDEDSTLWTLKRIELDEVLAVLKEHHPVIKDEDELFEALLDVMYKTRPTGPI
jgi:alpha-D-ribose 1-methylphosphonate 5-triphosphate synthase subunit PhnH